MATCSQLVSRNGLQSFPTDHAATNEDDTGGFYGGHDWEDEVIDETGGDFLCMHVSTRVTFAPSFDNTPSIPV